MVEGFTQNIYLIAGILGLLISLTLIMQVFSHRKTNFFLGLVVFIMAIEILFSWAAITGYTNRENALPFWRVLNYWVFPPSIGLFVLYSLDENFHFKRSHFWWYCPAILVYLLEVWSYYDNLHLIQYPLWSWYSDYLPMLGTAFALGFFWIKFYRHHHNRPFQLKRKVIMSQLRLLLLMTSLSLICLFWIGFSFIGWAYYQWIEMAITFMFLTLALLNFLESQAFPTLEQEQKTVKYPEFDDEKQLIILAQRLSERKYYLKPNLQLRELAAELEIPSRYLSYLINHHHKKNFKEFINQYRIEYFIQKAQSQEKDSKTLLGLALESGFSSKSTFNQVFKNQTGKSPKDYLKSPNRS